MKEFMGVSASLSAHISRGEALRVRETPKSPRINAYIIHIPTNAALRVDSGHRICDAVVGLLRQRQCYRDLQLARYRRSEFPIIKLS